MIDATGLQRIPIDPPPSCRELVSGDVGKTRAQPAQLARETPPDIASKAAQLDFAGLRPCARKYGSPRESDKTPGFSGNFQYPPDSEKPTLVTGTRLAFRAGWRSGKLLG